MTVIRVLTISFGNLLPTLPTMLIGLGRVSGDGVVVLIGSMRAGVALSVTASLALMACIWYSEGITRWVFTLLS